jgi:hypothetical protein
VTAAAPRADPQDLLRRRTYADRQGPIGRDYEPEPRTGIHGATGDHPADGIADGQALQRVPR